MHIKIGILHIPALDDDTGRRLRRLLHETLPESIVVLESYAGDHRHWIADVLTRWCDEEELDVLLTVGGTMPAPGPSGKEAAPDATLAVLERQLPGLSESMRAEAQAQTELALLDRSIAGIRGRTLILNLPAGAAPAYLFLNAVADLIAPVIAHLQESPDAPQLADLLVLEIDDDESKPSGQMTDRPSAAPGGLNEDEFAAFLARSAANLPNSDPPHHGENQKSPDR